MKEAPPSPLGYAHTRALLVRWVWGLSQPNPYSPQQINIDFHASNTVQEIFCSGDYGPSLPALRASAVANAFWASAL